MTFKKHIFVGVLLISIVPLSFNFFQVIAQAQVGTVKDEYKISSTTGNLVAQFNDYYNFGSSIASIGDLDGDGVEDIAVGVEFDDDGGEDRGAIYILNLNANGTVKSEQKISSTSGGFIGPLDNYDNFGSSIASIGDLDGDGVEDIAVGAHQDDDGGIRHGAIYILNLNANGTVKSEQKISSTSGGFIGPLDPADHFGFSIASIGDLDGDGVEDIAVGVEFDDDGGEDRGAIYILNLNANGTVKSEQKISSTSGGFTGPLDNSDIFGSSIASIGDLDGDGVEDIAVGARGDTDGGNGHGAIYILNLNANGTVKSEQKISSTSGGFTGPLGSNNLFGSSIASIGDLDDDGVEDIAVGASQFSNARGSVFILNLNVNGTVKYEQQISATTGGLTGPIENFDLFGSSIASIGDLDGDGVEDIAVGARADDDGGINYGAVYILTLNGASTPGVTVTESSSSTDLTEDGVTDTIEYVLDTQPSSNVTLTLEANSQLNFGSGDGSSHSLVFTPTNWNTPQTATVSAVDDNLIEAIHSAAIVHSTSSTDTAYNTLSLSDVTTTITDNDTASVTINPNSLSISENNGLGTFAISLGAEPSTDVVVDISSLDTSEATVTPSTLIFTPSNWDTTQTVSVSAVDDIQEGEDVTQVSIIVNNTLSDDDFDGLSGMVDVTLVDDDFDTDGDNVPDQVEVGESSNLNNSLDFSDTDNDFVPDYVEGIEQTNPNDGNDFQDSDSGGTPDYVEEVYFPNLGLGSTDPSSSLDDSRDTDSDTLGDYREILIGSQPNNNDDDGDGILTSVELEIPGSGDRNGDGVLDFNQSGVATILNPITNEYVTLVVTGGCNEITQFGFVAEVALPVQDDAGVYNQGLHNFSLNCTNPGKNAQIEIIWDTFPVEAIYKKFTGSEYLDISSQVTYSTAVIDGIEKTVVRYSITDGGPLDQDNTENGSIVDPAGPAIPLISNTLIRTGGYGVISP